MQYKDYLKSGHWQKLRKKKFKRSKTKACAICGSKEQLDIHHLIYNNLFDIKTIELRILCRKCHTFSHYLYKQGFIKFKYPKGYRRFSATKEGFTKYFGLKKHASLFKIWSKFEYKKEFNFIPR